MNIAIAVNKAYLKYASVMLTSLCTQQSENLNVYVLHHDLSPEDQSVLSSLPDKYQITIEYILYQTIYFHQKKYYALIPGELKPISGFYW